MTSHRSLIRTKGTAVEKRLEPWCMEVWMKVMKICGDHYEMAAEACIPGQDPRQYVAERGNIEELLSTNGPPPEHNKPIDWFEQAPLRTSR